MLPSMPLISTPLKEPVGGLPRNEGATEKDVELPMAVNYSGIESVSSSKDLAVSEPIKATDALAPHVEKQCLRPIAPKPVVVVISTPASNFTAVSHIASTEILPPSADVAQPSTDAETTKIPGDALGVDQPIEQPVEAQPSEIKEESQPTEERRTAEPVEKKDNEDELAALMLASTTIRSSPKSRSANTVKKKTKHIRDIEATLNLLAPDSGDVKNDKAFGFAQAYFIKVTERLEGKNDALYQEFLKTMNDFGHTIFSVPDLYHKITGLFHGYPDLAEEFVAFLLPEQAMECGKFMEYLMLTKMRDFFRMLEVYFAKQPQQMRKIYSSLSALSSQNGVTLKDVRSAILPLLKGNSLLIDSFLQLLPQERPPESIVSEFEEMDCGDADSYHSGDHFETVEVPDQKDMYGGDHCLCLCHETGDEKYKRRALHCVSCGTKFIYGKVFVQSGKVLRPAKVVFDVDKNRTIKRLSAKDRPKKCGRKRSVFRYSKDITPTKAHGEDARHDSEISPKSSRSNKSRTASLSNKKVPCKSSSSSKSGANEGNKSTPKDVKIGLCHTPRTTNSVALSKTRSESSPNALKKPALVAKPERHCASSLFREIPNLSGNNDELPGVNDKEMPLESRTDSQDSDTSMLIRDPALLSPECVITEFVTPLPLAALDECASTLPPDSMLGKIKLKDFSSLSQVLRPQEPDQHVLNMSISEEPENLSCKRVKEEVCNINSADANEVRSDPFDLSSKVQSTEGIVPQVNSESDLQMEVDVVEETVSEECNDTKCSRAEGLNSTQERTNPVSWTREEDKIILEMFQLECNAEHTFQKISQHLSQRTVDEVRERFSTLINLLEQMTGMKVEEDIPK